MTRGFEANFECPKCPYVASNKAQLTHHMVTNTIHGREKGKGPSKPEGRDRPKMTELERSGDFR